MTEWLNKFLQDEERGRNLIASFGIWVAIIVFVLALLNDYFFK